MRLDKQADGSFLLINVKENPVGLSSSPPLETKVAVLTAADVVQIVSDYSGDSATQGVIQALKNEIATQLSEGAKVQSVVVELNTVLEKASADHAALLTRIDELAVQTQDLATENGKLKATLEELAKPVDPELAGGTVHA